MSERRSREFGGPTSGIVPVTLFLPSAPNDPELAHDQYSTHCSHCGRRVLRRMTQGIIYLSEEERWCFACVRWAAMTLTEGHMRLADITHPPHGRAWWGRVGVAIAPSPDIEFDRIMRRPPRREIIAGVDLAAPAGSTDYIVVGQRQHDDLIRLWRVGHPE